MRQGFEPLWSAEITSTTSKSAFQISERFALLLFIVHFQCMSFA
jgi:hypothetical protein